MHIQGSLHRRIFAYYLVLRPGYAPYAGPEGSVLCELSPTNRHDLRNLTHAASGGYGERFGIVRVMRRGFPLTHRREKTLEKDLETYLTTEGAEA